MGDREQRAGEERIQGVVLSTGNERRGAYRKSGEETRREVETRKGQEWIRGGGEKKRALDEQEQERTGDGMQWKPYQQQELKNVI